jgi:hypothetical protein
VNYAGNIDFVLWNPYQYLYVDIVVLNCSVKCEAKWFNICRLINRVRCRFGDVLFSIQDRRPGVIMTTRRFLKRPKLYIYYKIYVKTKEKHWARKMRIHVIACYMHLVNATLCYMDMLRYEIKLIIIIIRVFHALCKSMGFVENR